MKMNSAGQLVLKETDMIEALYQGKTADSIVVEDTKWINRYNNLVELFDFDNATGVVSNSLPLEYSVPNGTNSAFGYGVEFSPDGTKLFASKCFNNNFSNLLQWDLCAGSTNNIVASRAVIFNNVFMAKNYTNRRAYIYS